MNLCVSHLWFPCLSRMGYCSGGVSAQFQTIHWKHKYQNQKERVCSMAHGVQEWVCVRQTRKMWCLDFFFHVDVWMGRSMWVWVCAIAYSCVHGEVRGDIRCILWLDHWGLLAASLALGSVIDPASTEQWYNTSLILAQTKAGRSLSYRPTWFTQPVPGQPELHSKTCLRKEGEGNPASKE